MNKQARPSMRGKQSGSGKSRVKRQLVIRLSAYECSLVLEALWPGPLLMQNLSSNQRDLYSFCQAIKAKDLSGITSSTLILQGYLPPTSKAPTRKNKSSTSVT